MQAALRMMSDDVTDIPPSLRACTDIYCKYVTRLSAKRNSNQKYFEKGQQLNPFSAHYFLFE